MGRYSSVKNIACGCSRRRLVIPAFGDEPLNSTHLYTMCPCSFCFKSTAGPTLTNCGRRNEDVQDCAALLKNEVISERVTLVLHQSRHQLQLSHYHVLILAWSSTKWKRASIIVAMRQYWISSSLVSTLLQSGRLM